MKNRIKILLKNICIKIKKKKLVNGIYPTSENILIKSIELKTKKFGYNSTLMPIISLFP